MKKVLIPVALLFVLSTSCTKTDLLNPGTQAVADNSRFDDHGGDDHGGNGGGGGGQRISSSSVPTAVMNAFKARYSRPTNIEWKKLDNGNYKVEFYSGAVRIQAIFSAMGVLVKEEKR